MATIGALAVAVLLASCPVRAVGKDNVATIRENYIDTLGKATVGFSVDMELPDGDSPADRAVREFLLLAVRQDIFSELGCDSLGEMGQRSDSPAAVATTLGQYNALWKEAFRRGRPECDTLPVRVIYDIKAERKAETADYLTYYYQNYHDYGGAHGAHFSYYITYDKRTDSFVNSGVVREDRRDAYRQLLLQTLNAMKRERGYEEDTLTADDLAKAYEYTDYVCDWHTAMPHFAILPEGVVVTFHPYQIGSYVEGEYHALLPRERISDCLAWDYWR